VTCVAKVVPRACAFFPTASSFPPHS
jgi:hypothetical protein